MLEGFVEYGYIGLFLAAFLAATLLPLSSEVVFVALLAAGLDAWGCILVASMGNWLGGMLNFYMGRLGKINWIEKYLKVKKEKIFKFQNWLEGKGAAMGFFVFAPVVGNVIGLALGFMRANVLIVGVTMFLGKFLRYVVIVYGLSWFI